MKLIVHVFPFFLLVWKTGMNVVASLWIKSLSACFARKQLTNSVDFGQTSKISNLNCSPFALKVSFHFLDNSYEQRRIIDKSGTG